MPYRNIECEKEGIYRDLLVTDIREDNPIFQDILKQLKEDIGEKLMEIKGITTEMIIDVMEKYRPYIVVQTIYCETCTYLQVDAGPENQNKVREDLWRSYETDRVVRQIIGGNNGRR